MAIPNYQTLMLPILQIAADGKEHKFSEAVPIIGDQFGLTKAELTELLPSGSQPVINNRAGWARTYLKKAGLLSTPRRGYFSITDRGRQVLATSPENIDNAYLKRFSEFKAFKTRRKNISADQQLLTDSHETPEDSIAAAYQQLQKTIEDEVLQSLIEVSPAYFEKIVVDILVKMGYGGNRQDAAKALGKTGDGGIDGIINEDVLGLDVIYVQAKRWQTTVSRPEVQKFAGALQGKRARKGVFITTSEFSAGAKEYGRMIESRIILIDGERLAKLMVEYGLGVSTVGTYKIKKLDSDYFDEG